MKFRLKAKILLLVILPCLLIGSGALLVSNAEVRKGMVMKIEDALESSAMVGVESYNFGWDGDFKSQGGKLYKGDKVITDDYSVVDEIKEKLEVEATLFYGDERVLTTILDESGKRLIGTKASDEVVKKVLQDGENMFLTDVTINGEDYYGYYIPIVEDGKNVGMFFTGSPAEEVNNTIKSMTVKVVAVILGIMAISIVVAVFMVVLIVNSINRSRDYLHQVAAGKLNFEENEKDLARKDEIGDIAQSIGNLKGSLTNIIGEIQKTAHVLHTSASDLDEIANQTRVTTEGVEQAVDDISAGAMSQAESTENASRHVIEMGDGIQKAVESVNALTRNAQVMKDASKQVNQALTALNETNEQTKAAMNDIYEQTNETNASVQKIKQATDLITSIADETNLLSLNASIEAARAGEAGRGFAVVAAQISKLAEQSSESATQISEIINGLIENSDKSVEAVEEVKRVTELQNEHLENTQSLFENVNEGIAASLQATGSIYEVTQKLDEIRQSVVDIVSTLSAIAQENAASTEETAASSAELSSTVNDLSESVTVLKKLADDLSESIKIFQI